MKFKPQYIQRKNGKQEQIFEDSKFQLFSGDIIKFYAEGEVPLETDVLEVKKEENTSRKTEQGVKFDDGKPDMALLPPLALEAVAEVLTFGARKYSADNWRGGLKYRRLASAALRHIFAFLRGENLDPETGKPHLAHATCCLLFLLEFLLLSRSDLDDRPLLDPTKK